MYTNDKDLFEVLSVYTHHLFYNENENDKNMNKPEKSSKKYTYRPQFGLVVMCKDEADQIALFQKLKAQGLTLKVVTV